MKLILTLAGALLFFCGCAEYYPRPRVSVVAHHDPCCPPPILFVIQNPYDLQIEAWDNRVGGAFAGATITILETGDRAVTGYDGITRFMITPANAQYIQVVVEWRDRDGYAHSYQTGIGLQHQVVTRARVWVDSTPPR